MAIAWMYRDDYAAAGLRMLPGIDRSGSRTATAMVLTAAMLLPVGAAASLVIGGWLAAVGATLVGAFFLWRSFGFARSRTDREARRVLACLDRILAVRVRPPACRRTGMK